MPTTIHLPPGAEEALRQAWGADFDRKAFEAMVIAGYRDLVFSIGRVKELLGFATKHEAEVWLASRGVSSNYTYEEYQKDCATLDASWREKKSAV